RPGGPQSGRVGTESRATGRTGRGIELGSVYAPPDAARFRPPCSLRSPCRLTVPQASHRKNTLVWCHGCALVLSWPTARVSVVNRSELARTFVFWSPRPCSRFLLHIPNSSARSTRRGR